MKKEEFVSGIKKAISDSMSDEMSYTFEKMKLDKFPKVKEMAFLYNSLNTKEKKIFMDIIKDVSERSLFGVLCVLDGVRAIENSEDKGKFELYFTKNGRKELLNPVDGEYLHELFEFNSRT